MSSAARMPRLSSTPEYASVPVRSMVWTGLMRPIAGYLLFAPCGPLLSKLSAREITFPFFTRRAAATMSSACVKFSVPISSSGPHLPQFLYFSAASRRSWRENFLSAIGLPFRKGRGGEAFRFLLVLRGRLTDDSINKTIRESLMMPIARMLAVLVALVLSAATSLAQTYPDKSVRVVVGFAAGGPT